MTFNALQLAPALIKAVHDMGFENPTPIQQQAIPAILEGKDLMAAAQTGTGKTGGFGLPILHILDGSPAAKNKKGQVIPRALILAPTRELAAQIDESFRDFAQHLKLKSVVIYGGVSMNPQIARLQRGVDIIIATPGRLLDLHDQGFVDASQVKFLVLDEADRMLDMGFIDDIRKIIELLPEERQNLLFSATFSNEIRELSKTFLKNPLSIEVAARNSTVELIQQIAHPVARARKAELLLKLIQDNQWFQTLIFTRTKSSANKVSEILEKHGIRSGALHGNKSQAARTAAMRDFKSGRIQALVATDIAARGIDIDQLPCVINYDLPNNSEDYVHRIGRTGRAGSEGVAISLVTVDEAGFMQQIEKFIARQVDRVEVDDFAPPPTEVGMPIVMGRQVIWGGIGKAPSHKATAEHVKKARQGIRNEQMQSRNERQSGAPSKSRDSKPRSNARNGAPSSRSTASERGWGRDKEVFNTSERSERRPERDFEPREARESRPSRSGERSSNRGSREGYKPSSDRPQRSERSDRNYSEGTDRRFSKSSEDGYKRPTERSERSDRPVRTERSDRPARPNQGAERGYSNSRGSDEGYKRSSDRSGRPARSDRGASQGAERRSSKSSSDAPKRVFDKSLGRKSEGSFSKDGDRPFGRSAGKPSSGARTGAGGGANRSGFKPGGSKPRTGQAPQKRSFSGARSSSRA